MKQEKMYSLAVRRRESELDHFWKHDDYQFHEVKFEGGGRKARYWFADPFVFEKNGITYLFYEAMDLCKVKGILGYSILHEDGTATAPSIIIEESFHLSFPYLFEYNGDIYIMPESNEDYRINLYKAVSFPDKWEKVTPMHNDIFACDSIIIESGGDRYLLANELYYHEPENTFRSCWVKNYLYKIERLSVKNLGIGIQEGDFGIRNAGNSFSENGILYRIGQDCRHKKYGMGLVLFQVDSVEPYHETILWHLTCHDISKHIQRTGNSEIIGVHTYNFSEHYEIVDFSEMRNISRLITIQRPFYNRRFRRILRKFFRIRI